MMKSMKNLKIPFLVLALFVLSLGEVHIIGAASPVQVAVTLSAAQSNLSATTVPAKTPLKLVVTNDDQVEHSLTLEQVGATARPIQVNTASGPKVARLLRIKPGETRSVTWMIVKAGQYQFVLDAASQMATSVVQQLTVTNVPTFAITGTSTPTRTATRTRTATQAATATQTATPTQVSGATATPTQIGVATVTTSSPTPTDTPEITATEVATEVPTETATAEATPTEVTETPEPVSPTALPPQSGGSYHPVIPTLILLVLGLTLLSLGILGWRDWLMERTPSKRG